MTTNEIKMVEYFIAIVIQCFSPAVNLGKMNMVSYAQYGVFRPGPVRKVPPLGAVFLFRGQHIQGEQDQDADVEVGKGPRPQWVPLENGLDEIKKCRRHHGDQQPDDRDLLECHCVLPESILFPFWTECQYFKVKVREVAVGGNRFQ